MRDYVFLGSSPVDEDCAQVGADNYPELSRLELDAYKKGLEEKYNATAPPDCYFVIREGEVCASFNDMDGANWAYGLEDKAGKEYPTWESLGLKRPKLDDPEFTKTELIPVPEGAKTPEQRFMESGTIATVGAVLASEGPKVVKWMGSPPEVCDMSHDPIVRCAEKIGNQFYDARTKQGQWGNLCPKCFGRWGVGLGTGQGQWYKKAVDGNFYKVEG